MSEEVTDELKEIYRKAYEDGIWLREFGSSPGSDTYMTAAGSISKLEEIEKQTGEEIDVSELGLADVVNISLPGTGKTREEACRDAIKAFKHYQKTG